MYFINFTVNKYVILHCIVKFINFTIQICILLYYTMAKQAAGAQWLKEHFGLTQYYLATRSYIDYRSKMELGIDGGIDQQFGPKYAPAEVSVPSQMEFMLKYDDINLDFLNAVMQRTDTGEFTAYLSKTPGGKYTRKLGFLYEWLTGKELQIEFEPSGNYINLLEEEKYITGSVIKNPKWRVRDNLLGTSEFCPMVRRTKELQRMLEVDLSAEIQGLKNDFSPEVFARAAQYLYRKETKSSYQIESETPSPERIERFINILYQAGKSSARQTLSEPFLTKLQNSIVDPRYNAKGFRNFQNFISQSSPYSGEVYHYICPPEKNVVELMNGLIKAEHKTQNIPAIVRAAIIAFGFVFIHPFEDGNGRIHRFLIHDMITRDGIAEYGMIIPVSAHMVNNMKEYDDALEIYSKPLMQRIKFTIAADGSVRVDNTEEVGSYFRYPDMTYQSAYLAKTIQSTIKEDLSDELLFLERYDELKTSLQNLIDMPDRRLAQIIIFLHQNKGKFPNRRKADFTEITLEEFSKMENIYRDIFTD